MSEQRKSAMQYGELYFWTATINGWKHLLAADEMKMEVIQSLQWLKAKGHVPGQSGEENRISKPKSTCPTARIGIINQ